MFCENFKAHALSSTEKKFIRLRCKKWDCDYCASLNRFLWRRHMRAVVDAYGVEGWSLVTVTARGRSHRHGTTLEDIIRNWDKLMKRLKRAWGSFEYMRVYEKHASKSDKQGKQEKPRFHGHMLVRFTPCDKDDVDAYQTYGFARADGTWAKAKRYRGIAHRQLKKACFGVGLGYIVDFSPITVVGTENNEHAINLVVFYITKYLTKNLSGLPKGTRRIQTSRAIGRPRGGGDGGDYKLKYYLSIEDIAQLGAIEDASRGHSVTFDDFFDSDTYPPDSIDY